MPARFPLPSLSLAPLLLLVALPALATCTLTGADGPCPPALPIGVFEPTGGFAAGCEAQVPITGDAGAAVLLELPAGCPGACRANDLACQIANGLACRMDSGSVLAVLHGARAGAVFPGFEARFAADTDQRSGICAGDYRGNGRRMAVLAVVANDGRGQVRLLHYALFFLRSLPASRGDHVVTAEYVGRSG